MNHESSKHRALFDFLGTIDPESLRCEIVDVDLEPGDKLVLYSFHSSYELADGSPRPVLERKSALLLVDTSTFTVIDVVMAEGYRTESRSGPAPMTSWDTEWLKQDGSTIKYRILPTGFERITTKQE